MKRVNLAPEVWLALLAHVELLVPEVKMDLLVQLDLLVLRVLMVNLV